VQNYEKKYCRLAAACALTVQLFCHYEEVSTSTSHSGLWTKSWLGEKLLLWLKWKQRIKCAD